VAINELGPITLPSFIVNSKLVVFEAKELSDTQKLSSDLGGVLGLEDLNALVVVKADD